MCLFGGFTLLRETDFLVSLVLSLFLVARLVLELKCHWVNFEAEQAVKKLQINKKIVIDIMITEALKYNQLLSLQNYSFRKTTIYATAILR